MVVYSFHDVQAATDSSNEEHNLEIVKVKFSRLLSTVRYYCADSVEGVGIANVVIGLIQKNTVATVVEWLIQNNINPITTAKHEHAQEMKDFNRKVGAGWLG